MQPDDVLGVLFAVGLIGGVFVWAGVSTARARKRAAERMTAMSGYAVQREWGFVPSDPTLVGRFAGPPFGRGQGQAANNVFRGRHEGREFLAFDHEFTTTSGSGKSRSTKHHFYSVVVLTLGLPTPGLSVVPTTTFGWLVNAVTGRDVEVGDLLFDQTFTVSSPSADFARDLLGPDVVQVALHHPELAWRFEGGAMLVIREGQHSPQEVEAKLHFMDAVLDRVPEHVRARLLQEPPR
ncbi:hypothetical protein [Nocardioides stalactiti]|uniref:hypothetical protein n=1 Tax=Nocardioides stalactiti TaxID=2755356 RepID=UPI001601C928|nr:hypothetical protein [Nocardioides stalactiti]